MVAEGSVHWVWGWECCNGSWLVAQAGLPADQVPVLPGELHSVFVMKRKTISMVYNHSSQNTIYAVIPAIKDLSILMAINNTTFIFSI